MARETLHDSCESATIALASSAASTKRYYQYDIYLTVNQLYENEWKFIVPPGLIGNMVIVLATLKMNPFNSTSLLMISLSLGDLTLNCIRIPMKEIRLITTVECKIMWYLYNVLPMYSNYILVFWTLDRVIAVQFPMRASALCTVKRTAIVMAATGVFSFAINVGWPIIVVSSSSLYSCRPSVSMVDFSPKGLEQDRRIIVHLYPYDNYHNIKHGNYHAPTAIY